MTVTPEFQGTHLWDRLCWAKENLEGVQSDYRVVYEDSIDECAKILVPDPNWMACALQGGILPPVEVYWELAKDEAEEKEAVATLRTATTSQENGPKTIGDLIKAQMK